MKKIAMILAAVCAMSIFPSCSGCTKGEEISAKLREEMSARAATAQFMPDAQTVMAEKKDGAALMSATISDVEEESAFDVFDMEKLLQSVAQIDSNGAGKFRGYEVDEIKTEMYNMVNRAPWLNEWFRVPRAEDGIDYFSNWAYLIENDLEYNFLSITRISWRTRASYYDSATGQEIEDYEGGSAVQYNVMRTQYYMEENTEIVEVEMADVMLEHGNTHVIAYQGLRNAKDKYFIKYNIVAKPRTDVGYAIDTDTPYGADREFIYLSYENSNFDLLEINQHYPHFYRENKTLFQEVEAGAEISFHIRKDGSLGEYGASYAYAEDEKTPIEKVCHGEKNETAFLAVAELAEKLGANETAVQNYRQKLSNGEDGENAAEVLLHSLSEKLVSTHALAKDWSQIYEKSERAEENILAEVELPIKVKYWSAIAPRRAELFGVQVKGYLVPNPVFRNMRECNYYLTPALMDEKGEIYFFEDGTKGTGNDFSVEDDIMWYGAWLELYRDFVQEDFSSFTAGDYVLITVLKEKGKDGHLENIYIPQADRVLFRTFEMDGKTFEIYEKDLQLRVSVRANVSAESGAGGTAY